ncbi:MAG TPA: NAD(P)H-dependent oxidoreductase [Smithellaceae bacterium]|nr:NAD(P)H-dependent oxidoreductase [Smithellaceae bacterium]
MKIAVLNGSPKGQVSVTMQYVHFLQLKFPEIEFEFFDIALKINKLEKDNGEFNKIIQEISSADAVLWAFPLYFFLVCSQYKRFIELIFERNQTAAFQGKPAASLTTSIKFFDHTAHNYISGVCDDLEMKYFGSYSAEMNDLHKFCERQRLAVFGELFIKAIENNALCVRNHKPIVSYKNTYEPAPLTTVKVNGKKVLIVTDDTSKSSNLEKMVENLRSVFSPVADLVQLKDIAIKGGCLGCMQCGMDNVCVYEGKDGFVDFFNNQVKAADILFFAGSVFDRFLSSLWKCFFDRSFFNGHTPALKDKQIGFVISGPFNQISNLREILTAYVDMQHSNLVGFVSDDMGTSEEINIALQSVASRAALCAEKEYVKPPTFYQIGGTKLFRDAVYGRLRPVFQSDHRYYQKHGFYDFPQKNYKWRLVNNAIIMLTKIPRVRREFVKRIRVEMIKPYGKFLKKAG